MTKAKQGNAQILPNGWEIKKLGDVCDTGAGGTPLKAHKDYYQDGTIPWLMSGEVSQGEIFEAKNFITEKGLKNSSAKLFPINTVLVAMYGATAGQVGILKFEACTNQAVCGILPNDKTIPEYLFYCFLSKKEELVAQAVGGAQPNISQIKIRNTKIPLPPLPEQQRIVSILDECFSVIERSRNNAEQNLKNAKELFESYLQEPFEKKGEGWEETSLKNEIELLVGFAFKSRGYTELQDDILLVRGDNIMQGYFRWEDAKHWTKTEYKDFEKYQLQENDIILAMDRPWVKAGLKIAKISKFDLPALLVQRTACIRAKDKLDNSLLFHLLSSKQFMQYLIDVQTGIGVPHISGQQILDFKFQKPSLKEQQSIVQKLDALSAETKRLELLYRKKLVDLEELRKSVLQKAFNGEL